MSTTTQRTVGELLEELAAAHGLAVCDDRTADRKWQAANAALELATVLAYHVERAVVEVENTGTLAASTRDVLGEETQRLRRRIQYARETA